ncbi:hypothetical protein [Alkalilimnicola sp. S0819]|uniref:hypothetical protein n=1 Tax=Alkalilimnicola sp. S0819 TaxID=2613922 RepID=UPI0012617AF2|nr:hypothetical protein [Alkalilimnicola sp. S0819]KAB7624392.1 hypothetical protein F3N43_06180 [Alkalilimnicola sp. S0819]MPQ16219.1 hypothetical protein [Alkalilimnicola sp. S0819]
MPDMKRILPCVLGLSLLGAAQATPPTDGVALGQAVADSELNHSRGRTSLHRVELSEISESAVLSGNSAAGARTGANTVLRGAFAGMNGVNSVIQNSGNNVIIQDATIVNVHMQ